MSLWYFVNSLKNKQKKDDVNLTKTSLGLQSWYVWSLIPDKLGFQAIKKLGQWVDKTRASQNSEEQQNLYVYMCQFSHETIKNKRCQSMVVSRCDGC